MSSSWGKKLEKKLNGLADTASKESIQTLSNWVAFNRKHAQTIAMVLTNALQDFKNNYKRQWLYWQLIHEILVREKGNTLKWEKLRELRLALGEALQPSMKILGSSMPDQLETRLEEWEDQDVFGRPSLNSQIRRLYQNRKNLTVGNSNATKTPVIATDNSSTSSAMKSQESSTPSIPSAQPTLEASKSPNEKVKSSAVFEDASSPSCQKSGDGQKERSTNDDCNDTMYPGLDDDDAVAGTEVQVQENPQEIRDTSTANPAAKVRGKSPSPQKRNSSLKEQVEYDFESKGVPSGPVESRDFLDPCKAITTLQIARDIRTNTAVEISTALANLPGDILTACQDLDSGELQELDTATTNEFSIRIPSSLIDLDLDEETSSLNMFQDIVQRQQKARENLTYLLLRSRCKFGSREAAREFYEIDILAEKLKKRKELLSDALELEGLDTNEIGNDIDVNNKSSQVKKRDLKQELPPLTWYKPDDKEGCESGEGQLLATESNKKQKVV